MKIAISSSELNERIELSYQRLLNDPYYQIDDIFSPIDYDWYGDKEGRALLAFVSHYKMSGKKMPCMDQMMENISEHLNHLGYFGVVYDKTIHEQQLSGHSWVLRGLCEYYEQFRDEKSLSIIKSTVKNLFLPLSGVIAGYPIERGNIEETGGISGCYADTLNGWILSTDVGCAFMSIDGLSHAYCVLEDECIKALVDEMIDLYSSIDKKNLKVQTHCTLSAARGMIRMYNKTLDTSYLEKAKAIYDLYVNGGGITYTYHNINWWGRPDTWSEPCAIVDSIMLATELYKITGEAPYRTFAARVYHNTLSMAQRDNGGAGTDTLVCPDSPWDYLQIQSYEVRFCCNMRLCEGLWYIKENADLLYAEVSGEVRKNDVGVYCDGDIIYYEVDEEFLPHAEKTVEIDGHILCPILKYWKIPMDTAGQIRGKIIF